MRKIETLVAQPFSPESSANDEAATPPMDYHWNFPALLRRRSLWLIGALLVVSAGAFGYYWAFGKAEVSYITAPVERGDVESTVVAAGILQPIKYVDVGAQTSGKLKSLKVKRGDHVEENQLLAEIDPVLADTALTSANATLENMTSQRSVKQAQLALAKAQRARNEKLFEEGIISASDRDITRANYDVAFAEVASLSAQMKEATAAVDTAKANRGYTKITAPMAGEVVSISLLEGQTLNANQQAPNILRIADMSTVTVWAQVSEADIVRVKLGQDVYFTVLGQSQRWNGKVRQILPTPELINNVVFYDVLFDIPNPARELNIQMTAQVFIVLAQVKGALLIPTAAIGNASEGAKIMVQVLKGNGSVEPRAIKIGIKSEISAEVTDGLKEKEQVVIREITVKGNARSPLSGRRGP
jgi:membrane fusion protein, macrolide-specific efflux system